ncbi:MAG: sulfurtransferase-like selenium metabolism protein YedF [Proteobacteria bacterium]|nr:sulfurtransferase-like selenium metabolism protein YedF [Pseudomonadota bacterium]
MTKKLDARGLTCPAPVLMVKDLVEKEKPIELTVIIDNAASSENVTRFLTTRNYLVTEDRQNGEFYLLAHHKDGGEQPAHAPVPELTSGTSVRPKILVLVTSSQLGRGDDLLGDKLMVNCLKTLKEMGNDLWQLIFVNSGVKLTIDSSPVLAELLEYEKNGVIILACGTCLEHFQLTAFKKVGATTNMLDIVTAMQLAGKVLTIG